MDDEMDIDTRSPPTHPGTNMSSQPRDTETKCPWATQENIDALNDLISGIPRGDDFKADVIDLANIIYDNDPDAEFTIHDVLEVSDWILSGMDFPPGVKKLVNDLLSTKLHLPDTASISTEAPVTEEAPVLSAEERRRNMETSTRLHINPQLGLQPDPAVMAKIGLCPCADKLRDWMANSVLAIHAVEDGDQEMALVYGNQWVEEVKSIVESLARLVVYPSAGPGAQL